MSRDFLFRRPEENQVSVEEAPLISVGYALTGEQVDINSPSCFAKKSVDTGTQNVKFFLKRCKSGPNAGQLLNPYGLNYMPGDEKKVDAGRNKYEFIKVNEEAFSEYLSFLKSKNVQFLRRAQRLLDT